MSNLILPNFLCIGTQKGGTSFLFNLLNQHPQIFIPNIKEIHFFDVDDNYKKGPDWYQYFFRQAKGYKAIGSITPSYMFFEYVPKRIKHTLGSNINFLVILRNPVDRAYSHYWMSFKRGYERLPFEQAILMEHKRIKMGYFEKNNFSYVTRGFYYEQLIRYFDIFPKENFLILIFDDFIKNPLYYLKIILNFLNCDEININNISIQKVHEGTLTLSQFIRALIINRLFIIPSNFTKILKYVFSGEITYPDMKLKTKKMLSAIFEDDILKLNDIINITLPWFL